MHSKCPTAIDLFCGCGGISTGARAAGFTILAGVDIEPQYMRTFTHNFPGAQSLIADLSSLPPKEFAESLGIKRGALDLLVGGPPCQGFSKNVPRRQRYIEDPRNRLVSRFLEYAEYLRPRLLVMENVAEMKNGFEQAYTEEIIDRLHRAGYGVTYSVLNAADFGVPQRRRRAFFLGAHGSQPVVVPSPSHVPRGTAVDLFATPEHVSVWEAIGDLPPVAHGGGIDPWTYSSEATSSYQLWARSGAHMVRNHVARRLRQTQHERLAALRAGQGLKDLPVHLRTRGGYSGAYGRLTKDMVAPTITRWVFHPGSGRWGHPVDVRTLTIREIARIQGFSDLFEFTGSFTQQSGQLGNAVPPLLAERILNAMRKQRLD